MIMTDNTTQQVTLFLEPPTAESADAVPRPRTTKQTREVLLSMYMLLKKTHPCPPDKKKRPLACYSRVEHTGERDGQ